jgi:SAM-dependent methyltransferase
LLRLARRLERAVRRRGIVGSAGAVWALRAGASGRRRVKRLERAFDREHGVDTAGVVRLDELSFRHVHKSRGVRYEGILPEAFDALLDGVPIGDGELTFVDLGAGKGRALLLASLLPFRRIVGVELSPELVAVAARNVERFAGPRMRCHELSVECADATTWEFPDEPLLVYLFNPFDGFLMQRVLANLDASLNRRPRRAVLVVANRTFPAELLGRHGFHALDDAGTRFERLPAASA